MSSGTFNTLFLREKGKTLHNLKSKQICNLKNADFSLRSRKCSKKIPNPLRLNWLEPKIKFDRAKIQKESNHSDGIDLIDTKNKVIWPEIVGFFFEFWRSCIEKTLCGCRLLLSLHSLVYIKKMCSQGWNGSLLRQPT